MDGFDPLKKTVT